MAPASCGDTAVPLVVVRVDVERGLALCADKAGEREDSGTELVAPVESGDRLLVRAGTALAARVRRQVPRSGAGAGPGRESSPGRAGSPLQGDGGLRRPRTRSYKYGVDDLLPDNGLVHGPGCPVCMIPHAGRSTAGSRSPWRTTG